MSGATTTGSVEEHTTGFRFWTLFLSLGLALGLSPLELTSVSTLLPTIVNDLHGANFIWVSAAYSLASTAIVPMSGNLAIAFGRKPCILLAIFLFALGSVLCGTARNMPWLIAGRALQGMGGGGVVSFTNIIISDLVPLKDRGLIGGVLNFIWAAFAAVGPVVGGALANAGQWRWLFYLNIFVCGLAFALVYSLVRVDAPPSESLKKRTRLLDWPGMLLIVASSTSIIVALTWSGVQYPWASSHVLVPLLVGFLGLVVFILYEQKVATNPITPFPLFMNRTTCAGCVTRFSTFKMSVLTPLAVSGYIQTFLVHFISLAIIYYIPTYYQACKAASAEQSGIDTLGLSIALGPAVAFGSWSVSKFKRYRPQFWVGWVLLTASLALMSTIKADSGISLSIGFTILSSIGAGIITSITTFPVLARFLLQKLLSASPFCFSCVCLLVYGELPSAEQFSRISSRKSCRLNFSSCFPEDTNLAYSAIPDLASVSEPTRSEIRAAFADSISVIWKVLSGLAGAGLIVSLFMKEVPMHSTVNDPDAAEPKADDIATGTDGKDKEAGDGEVV